MRNAKDRCRRVLNEHLPLVAQLPELPQHEQPLLPAGTDVLLSVDRFNDAVRQAGTLDTCGTCLAVLACTRVI